MKVIKYNLRSLVNRGTEQEPRLEEILMPVVMAWNEANEEIAKAEARNGEYTIEDDGQAEEVKEPTTEEKVAEITETIEKIKTILAKLGFPGV